MKIAIIGATGLIGQHAARAVLRNRHALRVIHRAGTDLGKLRGIPYEAVQADLNDRAALQTAFKDVDAVIHCAGYYPRQLPGRSGDVEQQLASAMEEMGNFCEAGINSDCKKFVYVSAASVLRKKPGHALADESMRLTQSPPRSNPFQLVKWWMEEIADQYMRDGMRMSIAIPSMVFGEYDYGPTAGRLITTISNGGLRRYVACERNIIYGPDLAEGLIRCARLGKDGERYILAGDNVSMQDLVQKIAHQAGVDPLQRAPLALAHAVALLQQLRSKIDGKAPSIKSTELRMLTAGNFLDTSKASAELGFRATTSVDQAIGRALGWFKDHGFIQQRRFAESYSH
ncbi:NAD-dependent epimerase/dehydratase family protein [soil metagenome]